MSAIHQKDAAIPLTVDIVSDVVCPWCIVGYKQFQKALSNLPQKFDVTLRWHPFELNPHMSPKGQELREHIAQKYGSTPEQSRAARSQLVDIGASLGFTFDYFDGMRIVNTFAAHQLLHWAATQGLQTQLKLALFSAFFTERKDVSDEEVLVKVAEDVGLDGEQAQAVLDDQRYADAVRQHQQFWLDKDVHAVPTFTFNGKIQVPGAQAPETFERVINKVIDL